jgi:hypothetical protein
MCDLNFNEYTNKYLEFKIKFGAGRNQPRTSIIKKEKPKLSHQPESNKLYKNGTFIKNKIRKVAIPLLYINL